MLENPEFNRHTNPEQPYSYTAKDAYIISKDILESAGHMTVKKYNWKERFLRFDSAKRNTLTSFDSLDIENYGDIFVEDSNISFGTNKKAGIHLESERTETQHDPRITLNFYHIDNILTMEKRTLLDIRFPYELFHINNTNIELGKGKKISFTDALNSNLRPQIKGLINFLAALRRTTNENTYPHLKKFSLIKTEFSNSMHIDRIPLVTADRPIREEVLWERP